MGLNVTVTKKGPGAAAVQQGIAKVLRQEVLVGIPAATTPRRGDPLNNASLLFIHTNGSPLRNIPARPVIEPAIAADGNRQVISQELKSVAKACLDGDKTQTQVSLKRAGMAGANASISWFTDPRNNWAPNTPETIRRKGSDKPLIDTSALRKSITYVVRVTP